MSSTYCGSILAKSPLQGIFTVGEGILFDRLWSFLGVSAPSTFVILTHQYGVGHYPSMQSRNRKKDLNIIYDGVDNQHELNKKVGLSVPSWGEKHGRFHECLFQSGLGFKVSSSSRNVVMSRAIRQWKIFEHQQSQSCSSYRKMNFSQ